MQLSCIIGWSRDDPNISFYYLVEAEQSTVGTHNWTLTEYSAELKLINIQLAKTVEC